jgi:hypothetical protein
MQYCGSTDYSFITVNTASSPLLGNDLSLKFTTGLFTANHLKGTAVNTLQSFQCHSALAPPRLNSVLKCIIVYNPTKVTRWGDNLSDTRLISTYAVISCSLPVSGSPHPLSHQFSWYATDTKPQEVLCLVFVDISLANPTSPHLKRTLSCTGRTLVSQELMIALISGLSSIQYHGSTPSLGMIAPTLDPVHPLYTYIRILYIRLLL